MIYLDQMPPWIWRTSGHRIHADLSGPFFMTHIRISAKNDNGPKPEPKPVDPKIVNFQVRRHQRQLWGY